MKQFEQAFEAWIDSFSGASGAVVANLLFYPLENFRTRIQAMQGNKKGKQVKQSTPKKQGETEKKNIDSTGKNKHQQQQ